MLQSYVVSVESPSEITMSTVERVRASRSKGLARPAVIAGVGRYLEDVFRPEEGIPDAPIAVANRSSTRRHWLGGLICWTWLHRVGANWTTSSL